MTPPHAPARARCRQVEACFQYAKQQLLLNTTVHAGEMADSEVADVTSAVLTMGVDRVGKPTP